jgi:NitT/TauT family transport system permease protein
MTMIDRLVHQGAFLPVLTVVVSLIVIWYAGAVYLNSTQLIDRYQKQGVDWNISRLAQDAWKMERPVLPAPHQVGVELKKTVFGKRVTSKRSLVYHAGITLSSSLLGFALGTLLGIALAIGIVYVTTLDRSLMPWIIASQTVPILAIAPMIIVVLGSIGITGIFPKSVISMYLCFFPVVVGMVKGLRSPEPILIDQMRTYSASPAQVFFKLRLPASIPFLFTSLKVAIALSVVGAIVAELPTGGQGGLGARLLTGSYYGQITMIWAALIVASVVSALLVTAVGRLERLALRKLNGGQVVAA